MECPDLEAAVAEGVMAASAISEREVRRAISGASAACNAANALIGGMPQRGLAASDIDVVRDPGATTPAIRAGARPMRGQLRGTGWRRRLWRKSGDLIVPCGQSPQQMRAAVAPLVGAGWAMPSS